MIGGRRVLVGNGQSAAAEVGSGCGVPVMDRRREVREKLHGFKTKLTEGLRRSGRCCGGGSAVDRARRRGWRRGGSVRQN